jgi:hypothetical protein
MFFEKKCDELKRNSIFAFRFKKQVIKGITLGRLEKQNALVAQLDRASDYGSEG